MQTRMWRIETLVHCEWGYRMTQSLYKSWAVSSKANESVTIQPSNRAPMY